MIYLISANRSLFPDNSLYTELSLEEGLKMLESWDVIQADSETTGRNPHICELLCFQFGNKKANAQIVVDTTTIPIERFKGILESKLLIFQNAKFDLQFLYKHKIVPTKIYDTMIVEQLLHLGFNPKYFHCSLKAIAERRLGIDIDKTVRGEIIWRGLDTSVILYAAGDVEYLEDIKASQEIDLQKQGLTVAAKVENLFVPSIAYLEWCGIKLDVDKWRKKMEEDKAKLEAASNVLNSYVQWLYKHDPEQYKAFAHEDIEGNLFTGYSEEPIVTINWSSPKQVIPFVQSLGFNTLVEDPKTGTKKDSIEEKNLAMQKGVNDDFLKVFFEYQEASKVCGTYGQSYIDAINPKTGRIHTTYKQLGAASGRMSCGGGANQHDEDLAKYKKIPASRVNYVQLQNLPADEVTRSAFVCERGNLLAAVDFAALESRLGADIYQEKSMIEEYLHGSGDIHSLTAKACFPEVLANVEVKDIKKLYPNLRKRAKPVEFSQQFGGSAHAIQSSLGCTMEEAKQIAKNYAEHFSGITKFKQIGSQFVRTHGYVLMCKSTGHKIYWEDFDKWRDIENLSWEEQHALYSSKDL